MLQLVLLLMWGSSSIYAADPTVNVATELKRLLQEIDSNGDKKITIDDRKAAFYLRDVEQRSYEVKGIYPLSNLLQELKLASDRGEKETKIGSSKIYENPSHRISRSIRELYWDGLTRRIDKNHLSDILSDSKVKDGQYRYLYVPNDDADAYNYFSKVSQELPKLKLKVVRLPQIVTPEYVMNLKDQHGLLSLGLRKGSQGQWEGVPFVVPGGRFNEMYGWDSYFESLGLIADKRVDLAQAMVDNFVYEIRHYGKILNANRTYYLTRSQPPFLTSMIRAVYSHLPKGSSSREWLARSLAAAIIEYETVWMGPDRLTDTGLSRYFGAGKGVPPEVEAGHFDPILAPFAKKARLPIREFQKRYETGKIQEPFLDAFFRHDRAVRESGHDTTYRWRNNGVDHASDFVTIDLNTLLYKYELDIAKLIHDEFNDQFQGAQSVKWYELAARRKELIVKYLWDPERRLFFDYDFVNKRRSSYVSATTFYPLWTWHPDRPSSRLIEEAMATDLVKAALKELETPGGLAATSLASLKTYGDMKNQRQWDYPNGWAPHQIIAWEGLRSYAMGKVADRLTYRWLYTITRNATDYNGTIPEKLDVVNRSHAVFAEYGNIGTQFSYITREGFGWMNASYQLGMASLSPTWEIALDQLIPPEWINN